MLLPSSAFFDLGDELAAAELGLKVRRAGVFDRPRRRPRA